MKRTALFKEYQELKAYALKRGYRVRLVVNGKLKDYMGMNPLAAKELGFKMPDREIWLKKDISMPAKYHTLKHELSEMVDMSNGMPYFQAHSKALKDEAMSKPIVNLGRLKGYSQPPASKIKYDKKRNLANSYMTTKGFIFVGIKDNPSQADIDATIRHETAHINAQAQKGFKSFRETSYHERTLAELKAYAYEKEHTTPEQWNTVLPTRIENFIPYITWENEEEQQETRQMANRILTSKEGGGNKVAILKSFKKLSNAYLEPLKGGSNMVMDVTPYVAPLVGTAVVVKTVDMVDKGILKRREGKHKRASKAKIRKEGTMKRKAIAFAVPGDESSSGKHEVAWAADGDLNKAHEEGRVKKFKSWDDAVKFADRKATEMKGESMIHSYGNKPTVIRDFGKPKEAERQGEKVKKLPELKAHTGGIIYAEINGKPYSGVELRSTEAEAKKEVDYYRTRGYDAKLALNKRGEGAKFSIVVPQNQLSQAISNEMGNPPTIKPKPTIKLVKLHDDGDMTVKLGGRQHIVTPKGKELPEYSKEGNMKRKEQIQWAAKAKMYRIQEYTAKGEGEPIGTHYATSEPVAKKIASQIEAIGHNVIILKPTGKGELSRKMIYSTPKTYPTVKLVKNRKEGKMKRERVAFFPITTDREEKRLRKKAKKERLEISIEKIPKSKALARGERWVTISKPKAPIIKLVKLHDDGDMTVKLGSRQHIVTPKGEVFRQIPKGTARGIKTGLTSLKRGPIFHTKVRGGTLLSRMSLARRRK